MFFLKRTCVTRRSNVLGSRYPGVGDKGPDDLKDSCMLFTLTAFFKSSS